MCTKVSRKTPKSGCVEAQLPRRTLSSSAIAGHCLFMESGQGDRLLPSFIWVEDKSKTTHFAHDKLLSDEGRKELVCRLGRSP